MGIIHIVLKDLTVVDKGLALLHEAADLFMQTMDFGKGRSEFPK